MFKPFSLALAAVAGAMFFASASAVAAGVSTKLEAGLSSGASLKGKAAYVEESLANGRVRQKVSVEVQGAKPGTALPVTVNGVQIATITVDTFGRARMEVRAGGDDPGAGQNKLPFLKVGDSVAAGTATGKLARK